MTDQEPEETSSLVRAIEHWGAGQWASILAIESDSLVSDADKALFALLQASSHQQLGATRAVESCIDVARKYGCSKKAISLMLIAGVYNILGRSAALLRDKERAKSYFVASIELAQILAEDHDFVSHRRAFQQLTDLGLLRQAVESVETQFKEASEISPGAKVWLADRLKILGSEIDSVNHELALALRRNQLYRGVSPTTGVETPERVEDQEARLSQLSPSQLGQDIWVLKQSAFKRGGFFVEFGATDGILLSNSYLLEKEFDWDGICAEPNPHFFELLKENRTCTLDSACISSSTGAEVEFILANEYGGMTDFAAKDQHAMKREAYRQDSRVLMVKTISLDDFLKKHNAPKTIDYISIDTEGSEFEILRTFPFDEWNVRHFTIEHNRSAQRDEIFKLLVANGYKRTEAQWDDWYEKIDDGD